MNSKLSLLLRENSRKGGKQCVNFIKIFTIGELNQVYIPPTRPIWLLVDMHGHCKCAACLTFVLLIINAYLLHLIKIQNIDSLCFFPLLSPSYGWFYFLLLNLALMEYEICQEFILLSRK